MAHADRRTSGVWRGALVFATVPACPKCATQSTDGAQFCGNCGAELEPSGAPDLWIGRVVDGRYRVLERIGSGGMGVVYRVEHLRLGKMAAMKVLSPDTATKQEMVQRFKLEAQAISRLNHPNIVQTFDFGLYEDALYLIMEYVKGDDLAVVLKREGPLAFARAAKMFVQVCSALTEAHDHGIIHRDLKPENLMVHKRRDGSEHVKVLDFGLAKLRERDETSAITTGKQILGTPYYMAPEQVRGETLDPRADVYALGATLYRVLTGAPPFQAPSPMGILSKHVTDQVVPPRLRAPERELPLEADEIVLRAMAKGLEDRYPSAAAVQHDLERVLAALAAPASIAASAARGARRAVTVAEAPTLTLEQSASEATEASETSGDSSDPEGQGLQRQDLDLFERSMRRRRVLTWLALPLGLVAIAAGAVATGRWRAERPTAAEREPNNTPGYANLLASGRPVRGTIGALIEGGHGDVDYFRVPVGHGARVMHARLEGVPELDLVLEVFDAQGRRLAKSDAHGRGGAEWLQPISIGPAEAFLAVREVWVEGQKPVEGVTDAYALTATWGPPQTGWEIEPNDWEAAATPVPPGTSMRGYLGEPEDKDWFTITPATSGHLRIHVSVPAGVDAVLLHDGAGKRTTNRGGPGEDEEAVWEALAGQAALVGVAHKPLRKSAKDEDLSGLDSPYELRAEVF
jgi:serine/threonine protein kinase